MSLDERGKENIELCVRAFIQHENKILVCKTRQKDYYFFPGGHIDFGEGSKQALIRELKEELGVSVKKCSFIGVAENMYEEEGRKHHEINLVFQVLLRRLAIQSKEDHLVFALLNESKFSQERVLPLVLQKALMGWLHDKKIFWVSNIHRASLVTGQTKI